MRFLIITHVKHKLNGEKFFAYAPYVHEMNIWLKHVDEINIVAPKTKKNVEAIDLDYKHDTIQFSEIPSIEFTNFKSTIVSLIKIPLILISIFRDCKKTDHIHLRCPGNIGLLGCLVQIIFPNKTKTAKYAGNWDPKAKQPLSYRIQKRILSNTFLTRNMTVLVYGNWDNQSKNIKSFFTATYSITDLEESKTNSNLNFKNRRTNDQKENNTQIKFLFVGALTIGKRPLLTVKVIQKLVNKGYNVTLDIFGDGPEHNLLIDYVKVNELKKIVKLHGNVSKEIITQKYKTSHFLLFISKSEGWPKVVAEAMFWGCLPISSYVSCIPYMLDNGNRGALVGEDMESIVKAVENYLSNEEVYHDQVQKAMRWSRQYTMEKFDNEISKLVIS